MADASVQTSLTVNTISSQTINNVIVNELLCFISNKAYIMTYELVVKLCNDFYNDEDVKNAKDIIWTVLESKEVAYPEGHRKPRKLRHNGTDKRLKDIQDILNVYLELPPANIPSFLAKDLPPINMNCVDVSSVIKDMSDINNNLKFCKRKQTYLFMQQYAKANLSK